MAILFNLLAAAVVKGILYLTVRVGLVAQSDFPTLVVGIIGVVGALGAAWLTVYLTRRARRRS